ncbi:hypothetical protein BU16DRAFT_554855 [Lophium mytilinum]|uniref:Geranylgeranyl pyrophosphate synthetase n=1 Tax=Lophium mytilinum TaxID=390894 RepID=A0A6A6REL4_9PEZI|nr:hypothetical protein BU16DRAFT_554855 [Lophium mytilinum]
MPLLASRYATATRTQTFRAPAGTAAKVTPTYAPGAAPNGSKYTPANGAPVTKESLRAIKHTWMNEDVVGRPLRTWVTSRLKDPGLPVTIMGGLEEVVTYNWSFDDWKSSHAPGPPPKFTPPAELPKEIPRNSGTHYVNQDAHLEERHPFKPMFSALEKSKPDYDMKDVDIVVDSGTLLTLLGFLDGLTEDDIRIELHLVENTLILTSREQYTSIEIDPKRGSLRPYEHSFPKHCSGFPETEKGAHTHHRAVRYKLGGMNWIVKSQPHVYCEGGDYVTEGTLSDADQKHSAEALKAEKEARLRRLQGLDDTGVATVKVDTTTYDEKFPPELADAKMAAQDIQKATQDDVSPATVALPESDTASIKSVDSNESTKTGTHSRNVSDGSAITTASMPSNKRITTPCYAEMTARFEGNKFKEEPIDTPYHFPRMYFGRIPTIIVGTYRDGSFSSIQAFDSKRMLHEWERERQEDLRKLVHLLRQWKDTTKQAGGKAVALCDAQFWPLKFDVYKMQSTRGVLEEEMVTRFWKTAPAAKTVVSGKTMAKVTVTEETKTETSAVEKVKANAEESKVEESKAEEIKAKDVIIKE